MFCAAIILAGGKSERMHFPKLYLNYDGRTFVEKIIDEYKASGIKEIVVVINETYTAKYWQKYISRIKSKSTIIRNKDPEKGRIYSLQLGVKAIRQANFCFIQNVDNPFVESSLIKKMMKRKNRNGYVVPVHKNRGGHPVLVNNQILNSVSNSIVDKQTLRTCLMDFNRKEIDSKNDTVLVNMNTSREYYKEMLKYGVLQYIQ